MAAQRGGLGSDRQPDGSVCRAAPRPQGLPHPASHDPSAKTAMRAVSTCSYKHPHVTEKSLPHVTSPRGSLQRRPWAPRPGGRCLPTLGSGWMLALRAPALPTLFF